MEADVPLPPSVYVVACGYRQTFIPKSGLTFPAWLVACGASPPVSTPDSGCETVSAVPVNVASTSLRWRTKRDFGRLGRVAARTATIVWPKAAWRKLSDQSPWQRPNDDTMSLSFDPVKMWNPSSGDLEVVVNQWHPCMKKSLLQIDQFLQRVAWACRDSHTAHPDLMRAWNEFCRDQDSDQVLLDGCDANLWPPSPVSLNRVSTAQQGNAWGQYFCTPANARQLTQCFWKRLLSLRRSDSNLLVVEPSCGHGQIVWALAQHVHDTAMPKLSVLGLDIDEAAVDYCRAQADSRLKIDSTTHCDVQWTTADFLRSRRPFLIPIDSDGADNKSCTVAMIGGPPYSAGAGGGKEDGDMQLDLPTRFVAHALQEWQAIVVAFLMPSRCRNTTYSLPQGYRHESIELHAPSVFHFQGNIPVQQPSIIQCFWKEA